MMASLRAVSELQNPAIKDRHWHQLMAETNVLNYFNYIFKKKFNQKVIITSLFRSNLL